MRVGAFFPETPFEKYTGMLIGFFEGKEKAGKRISPIEVEPVDIELQMSTVTVMRPERQEGVD
jgi:hypothetical protein